MIFDPLYLLFIAPGFLLALWASYRAGRPLAATLKWLLKVVIPAPKRPSVCSIGLGFTMYASCLPRLPG